MFWELVGGPLFYIAGVIIIIGIVIGGFKIKSSIKKNKVNKLYNTRIEVFSDYLSSNPKTFTNINSTWNDNNLFYAKNDKGTFSIRFVDTTITEVIFTTNGGYTQVLYRK